MHAFLALTMTQVLARVYLILRMAEQFGVNYGVAQIGKSMCFDRTEAIYGLIDSTELITGA